MMRWNDFGRSLGFAVLAAAALVPFTLLVEPWLGWRGTLVAYAATSASLYLFGAAPSASRGILSAAALALGAPLLAGLSPSAAISVCALAVALGGLRSGHLYRARFARSLVLEGALISFGLLAAAKLFDGSTLSAALAVWAFYLTQSAFFLFGGVSARESAEADGDAFENAHARALALLAGTGPGKVR